MPIFLIDKCEIFLILATAVALITFIRYAMFNNHSLWTGVFCVLALYLSVGTASRSMGLGERHHRLVTMQADLRSYCARNHCIVESIDPDGQTANLKLAAGCKETPPLFQVNGRWEPSLSGPTGDCLPPLP